MRWTSARWTCMMVTVAMLHLIPAQAQEAPDSASQADMMAQHMELASPGPEHERLAALVGTWKMETKMWMAPGTEPMTVSGKISNRMILGGRFLMSEAESGEGFMATESVGLMGFDRRSGQYTTVGFDTWGTYYVTGAGSWDEERGAIVLSGEDYDAATDHTQIYDFILTPLTSTTYRFEVMFKDELHTQGGDPFKMVEVLYTKLEVE
jgi:hypothetical protein